MRLAVTTPLEASPSTVHAAREAADRRALPFRERRGRSLPELAAAEEVDTVLVLGPAASILWADGEEQRWHPGMGELRAKRLLQGERTTVDSFLEAARLRPGETVLDCTLGMGADAFVAATAAGPAGRVTGIESSPALAAWVGEGLARHPGEAARRIEVVCSGHDAFLAAAAERSFDVVVFDPMFRHARAAEPRFDLLRRLGDASPLARTSLDRARRVARRGVLVKDGAPGWDLTRLGLSPLPSARGAERFYAWIDSG